MNSNYENQDVHQQENNNVGDIELNSSLEMKIKIRSLDNEFLVDIGAGNKVEELKNKIENISKVPKNRQRLIFRGKLLKDNDSLSLYKIADLDVVHLVAKTAEQIESSNNEENEMNSDSNSTGQSGRREATLYSIMNRLVRLDNDNNLSGNSTAAARPTIIPAIMGRRVRRGSSNGEISQNSDFNSIESRETIKQNSTVLNTLIECSNLTQPVNYETNENIPRDLFDFKKKRLIKGQWVDVKDTIEQWLEAQVIDTKENSVYIHYNGWGTRWDEWISMDSDRIRPFRYHTRQTVNYHYQSPFPIVKPDANVSLGLDSSSESFFDIFESVDKAYDYTRDIMKNIKEKKKETSRSSQKEIYRLSKNIAPIMDKLGRLMTDIGCYINTSMRNNKLEDLDKKLYDSNNLDTSLKPYDQNEIQRIQHEEAAKRSRRETGMNVITPVNTIDREIINQVPLLDSPFYISNNRNSSSAPIVDIYVQTFYSPVNGRGVNLNSGTSREPVPQHQGRTTRERGNPFDLLFDIPMDSYNGNRDNNAQTNIHTQNHEINTEINYEINNRNNIDISEINDKDNVNMNNNDNIVNHEENDFLGSKRNFSHDNYCENLENRVEANLIGKRRKYDLDGLSSNNENDKNSENILIQEISEADQEDDEMCDSANKKTKFEKSYNVDGLNLNSDCENNPEDINEK